jgi:hypothetical protein
MSLSLPRFLEIFNWNNEEGFAWAGKPIDIDPPFVYSSPHMNALLGSDVVTASYGNYELQYDFSDDTITRSG